MDHHNRYLGGALRNHVLDVHLADRDMTRSCPSYIYGGLGYIFAAYDEAALGLQHQRRLRRLKI